MKKLCAAVLAIVCMSGAVSALDLSVGGIFDYTLVHNFGTGRAKLTFETDWVPSTETLRLDKKHTSNMLGVKGFFDAQYAMAQFGCNFAVGETYYEKMYSNKKNIFINRYEIENEAVYLNFGVFGKYPFTAAKNAKIYPLIGVDFDFAVFAKGKYDNDNDKERELSADERKELNAYWFDVGAGADIYLIKKFFIRPQLLFGIMMNQKDIYRLPHHGIKFNAEIGAGWKL